MAQEMLAAALAKLNSSEPHVESRRLAAVAVIFEDISRPRILLIKRAVLPGDPWSGQVAFPGGKMAETDGSAMEIAVRETKEEVGIDLSRHATFSGYYRPFRTHTGNMDVIPAVFQLKNKVEVVTNQEVSGYRWVALQELLLPRSASSHLLEAGGAPTKVPAFKVGGYLVWGLTHRILSSLLDEASL